VIQKPETLLVITPASGVDGFWLPPYSARNLTQTLEPIGNTGSDGVLLRRDINGDLYDLTQPQFRKYSTTITCKDLRAPTLDDAWIGQLVMIDCALVISFPTSRSAQRAMVPGSDYQDGHLTFYRPRLLMRVTSITHSFEEYQADYSWKLEAKE
jgi:hypothetical protein